MRQMSSSSASTSNSTISQFSSTGSKPYLPPPSIPSTSRTTYPSVISGVRHSPDLTTSSPRLGTMTSQGSPGQTHQHPVAYRASQNSSPASLSNILQAPNASSNVSNSSNMGLGFSGGSSASSNYLPIPPALSGRSDIRRVASPGTKPTQYGSSASSPVPVPSHFTCHSLYS